MVKGKLGCEQAAVSQQPSSRQAAGKSTGHPPGSRYSEPAHVLVTAAGQINDRQLTGIF